MRIISGELKGRRFDSKLPPGIRPTTDSNKETIFNILSNHLDFEGILVCDLCAGTGNLGFEAISRGAEYCTFVDISSKSLRYIESAGNHFGLDKTRYECIKSDSLKFLSEKLSNETGVYDLIFIDPPYDKRIGNLIINKIISNNYLEIEGLIVAESAVGDGVSLSDDFEIISQRIIGETQFHIIRRNH